MNLCLMKSSSIGGPNLSPTLWKKPCIAKTYYHSHRTERQMGTGKNFIHIFTSSLTHAAMLQYIQVTVKYAELTTLLMYMPTLYI